MEKTCGNCPQLTLGGTPPRMPLAVCQTTENIVPHQWDGEVITLWRVPPECPRTEGVEKSEKQAPKKAWITKTLDEMTPFEA